MNFFVCAIGFDLFRTLAVASLVVVMLDRGERIKISFKKISVVVDDNTVTDKIFKGQKLKLEESKSSSSTSSAMQKKSAKKIVAKKSLAKKLIAKLSKTSIFKSQLVSSKSDFEDDENKKNNVTV